MTIDALLFPKGRIIDLRNLMKELGKDELVLGRGKEADIRLEDVEPNLVHSVVLKTVSKKHAILYYDGLNFNIQDHSENGTKVNSISLEKEPRRLENNDVLIFGAYGDVKCLSYK